METPDESMQRLARLDTGIQEAENELAEALAAVDRLESEAQADALRVAIDTDAEPTPLIDESILDADRQARTARRKLEGLQAARPELARQADAERMENLATELQAMGEPAEAARLACVQAADNLADALRNVQAHLDAHTATANDYARIHARTYPEKGPLCADNLPWAMRRGFDWPRMARHFCLSDWEHARRKMDMELLTEPVPADAWKAQAPPPEPEAEPEAQATLDTDEMPQDAPETPPALQAAQSVLDALKGT